MNLNEVAIVALTLIGGCLFLWTAFAIGTRVEIDKLQRDIEKLHAQIDHLETNKREEELRASFHQRLITELDQSTRKKRSRS